MFSLVTSMWKAIAKYAALQTYTEIRPFLGLVGHYRWFIKGFARIAQPLNEHLAGEVASRKSERVVLIWGSPWGIWCIKTSPAWTVCCWLLLIIPKDFLLETDASKEGLGAVLSQKTGWQTVSPSGLWQLGTHQAWKELPFYEARVSA